MTREPDSAKFGSQLSCPSLWTFRSPCLLQRQQAVLYGTTINTEYRMNASLSGQDKNPSSNKSQPKMAKRPLHKRQFCFSRESPLARAPHLTVWLPPWKRAPHLKLAPWNLPGIRNSTYLFCWRARRAYPRRLVFHLTKGSQMPNTGSERPLLPSPETQMKHSPCENNILCNDICCLRCHTAGNSFLVPCS